MNKVKTAITLMSKKGFVCDICDEDLSDGKKYTVDHIIPKTYGGSDTVENLEILCLSCNIKRRNRIGARNFYIHMQNIKTTITDKIKPELLSYEKRHGFITNEQIEEMEKFKNEVIEQIELKFKEIEKLKNQPIEKLGRVNDLFGKSKFPEHMLKMSYEDYKKQNIGGSSNE